MNNGIFLLLGSNEGYPLRNLREAAARIEKAAGKIVTGSSVFKTAAWGFSQQPDFYNQVLEIESDCAPEQLLEKLLAIEAGMGRIRSQKWGPRIIDIDILFYGQQVIHTPVLQIPHPGIPERRFTLVPLAEIAPDLLHPLLNKSMTALLEECTDSLPVEPVSRYKV